MTTTRYKHWSDVNPIHWYWPNFTQQEVACQQISKKGNCGCGGTLLIDHGAMNALQRMRNIVGVPVIINSAYRCPKHNANVGGALASQHLKGKAFDILITPRLTRDMIHKAGKDAGFTSFGDYNTFVHCDTRETPAYWDFRSK